MISGPSIDAEVSAFHEKMMRTALQEAQKAYDRKEVPVGAVLTDADGEILAASYNQTVRRSDPTAHAEILTIRQAAAFLNNYRLLNTTLYVTIEPCLMCMGAVIHARISLLVYGAPDPKWGAAGSLYDFSEDHRLNHQPSVTGGVCADTCSGLIRTFFQERRLSRKSCRKSGGRG